MNKRAGEKMKNRILLSTAATFATLTMVACMNDFLVKSPTGTETATSFFKNVDQNNRALTAVYDALAWDETTELNEWFIGDIVSDDALKGGESAVDQADIQALRNFRNASSNGITSRGWRGLYQGIYRA